MGMKIVLAWKAKITGATTFVMVVICSLLCLTVLGYLTEMDQQSRFSSRSQAWNIALAITEAGIEDGLQHLNRNRDNLAADSWTASGSRYHRKGSLTDGSTYDVVVDATNPAQPEVIAQAYARAYGLGAGIAAGSSTPASEIVTRTVRVRCYKGHPFQKAIAAKKSIDLNGNNIATDSFDSSDPFHSNNGLYDPALAKDNGSIICNNTVEDSIDAGNANIRGQVSTGPGGTVALGTNGVIGSLEYQTNYHHGIQSGWVTDDANFTFPDTQIPYTSGLTPTSGDVVETVFVTNTVKSGGVSITNITSEIVTNHYDNILYSGQYYVDQLSGKTIVLGAAQLVAANGITMSGSDVLKIAPGGSLTNWNGGTSSTIGGNGLVNDTGMSGNYIAYFAPSVTKLSIGGNGTFVGVVCAPSADMAMNGSGKNSMDFVGSLMVNSLTMNGHFNFHYDEALGNIEQFGRWLISAWDEIPPMSFAAL